MGAQDSLQSVYIDNPVAVGRPPDGHPHHVGAAAVLSRT